MLNLKELYMKPNRLMLILSGCVFICGCAQAAMADDVEEFIQLLSKETSPTLNDFSRFYGEGSEDELEIELYVCEKKGWTPTSKNPNCLKYIHNRNENQEKTPSMYFAWLKQKLPRKPKLMVHKVERVERGDNLPYELIHATLDNVKVIFYRPLKHTEHFGRLSIREINGVSISKLLHQDIKEGKLPEQVLGGVP